MFIFVNQPIFEIFTFMQYFKQYAHDCKIYPIYNFLEKVILVLLRMKTKNNNFTKVLSHIDSYTIILCSH
jgi:hypothetical protein